MKKVIRFFLIAGCIIFLIGIGLVTTGFIMGGADSVGSYLTQSGFLVEDWYDAGQRSIPAEPADWRAPLEADPGHPVPADAAAVSGIQKLEIEAGLGRIKLVHVPAEELMEDSIRVWGDGNGQGYQIFQEGNHLEISLPKPLRRHQEMETLILYVADDMVFEQIEIEVKAGAFYADKIQAESLSLEANAGTIEIEDGYVNRLEIDCNAGEVICRAKADQKIEADCAAGSVELSLAGTKTQYNYELECTTGSIILDAPDREEYSGLRKKTQINNQVSSTVELDCKAGSITVYYPDAAV